MANLNPMQLWDERVQEIAGKSQIRPEIVEAAMAALDVTRQAVNRSEKALIIDMATAIRKELGE